MAGGWERCRGRGGWKRRPSGEGDGWAVPGSAQTPVSGALCRACQVCAAARTLSAHGEGQGRTECEPRLQAAAPWRSHQSEPPLRERRRLLCRVGAGPSSAARALADLRGERAGRAGLEGAGTASSAATASTGAALALRRLVAVVAALAARPHDALAVGRGPEERAQVQEWWLSPTATGLPGPALQGDCSSMKQVNQ